MPAKTPIYLKTPTDRKGRRLKLRDILSGDMISPPLGDVRHSAHVGPQGLDDMFGDVAFLQGNMDVLPSMRAPHNGHEPPPQTLSPDQDPSISAALWSTTSQEQAPPKPPRLHLETPPQHGPAHYPQLPPQNGPAHYPQLETAPQHRPAHYPQLETPPQHGPAHYPQLETPPQHRPAHYPQLPSQNGPTRGRLERDISLDHTIQRLVSSSGSSSEDSLFDTCGPLGATQGLSLDSDAGLSNEDLRSEGSPTLPHTDSILASLNLDLGPSIMEDVLSIMDRYKGPSESPNYGGPSESPGS